MSGDTGEIIALIPAYNEVAYIADVVVGVLKHVPAVVVDDGSTDNTREVLTPYLERIRYIRQENGGRSKARNTGIREAMGRYIAFLDSDDHWIPNKLGQQIAMLSRHREIDFLFGDKQRFADDGTIIIESMFRLKGYDSNYFGDGLYVRNPYRKLLDGNFVPTGTVIMKRECFEQIGLFDELIYAEDFEFWLRVALFCTMAYASELWELERDRPGSGSKNLKAVYLSHLDTFEKHERVYADMLRGLGIDLNAKIRDVARDIGLFLMDTEKVVARECFGKSLKRGFRFKTFVRWLATFA
jgi:glycosyltransferase involved in cell wall biosynthesis